MSSTDFNTEIHTYVRETADHERTWPHSVDVVTDSIRESSEPRGGRASTCWITSESQPLHVS
jgi:hypothetical protein